MITINVGLGIDNFVKKKKFPQFFTLKYKMTLVMPFSECLKKYS